jgi:predicted permease
VSPTDLAEAWRVSRVSYTELVYRPLLRHGSATKDSASSRSVKNALRGATLNKLIFSVFTMGGAVFPFLFRTLQPASALSLDGTVSLSASISLSVAVSLSILLVFGYIVLYSIQVLPTFVSSGSFAPLAQLPISSRDRSLIATLTLWRSLDYILVLSIVTQLGTVAFFTDSAVATLIVLLVSVPSSVLAVATALWLTSVFQSKLEGGRMGGLRGLFGPLLYVVWGLGVMSAVFLFSLVSFLSPALNALLAHPASPAGIAASLAFPFSAGLLVASLSGEVVGQLSLVLASAGVAIAVIGSAAALLGASRLIDGIVLPRGLGGGGPRTADYSFSIRGPLLAYMLKDVRVASRNPATGFLFALPVFEVVFVVVQLTVSHTIRMSALLVGTQVGGGFALFIAFLLVTVEDLGVERRSALPLRETVRTLSKVLISTAMYIPVPIALAVVLLTRPSTFGGSLIIPFASLLSLFTACIVEVVVLNALTDRGRGAEVRFTLGVGSGELALVLPALVYAATYLTSRSQVLSVEALLAGSAVELGIAALILRRIGTPTASLKNRAGVRAPSVKSL